MNELQGYEVATFPFPDLDLVGILLYHDFPSTIVYAEDKQSPIIIEWVDCADDRKTHRYLAYKSSIKDLTKYIYGNLSHYNLIKSAADGLIVSYDEANGRRDNMQIIPFSKIPLSYLPKKDVYFESDEEVDLNDVIDFFNIPVKKNYYSIIEKEPTFPPSEITNEKVAIERQLLSEISQKELLKVVARQENSEVINMHIKEGSKIGFGTADTYVLGRLLITIDDLYRETALDHEEGVDRDNLRSINSKRGQSLYPRISTRVVLAEAASYSVFIRPIETDETSTDNHDHSILQKIFSLFSSSGDKTDLSKSKEHFSSYVYKSYQEFLEVIKLSNVDLECNFYNPFKEESIDQEFEYDKAIRLLENIRYLTTTETEKISLNIQFKALNTNTGHYTLKLKDGKQLKGHFDDLLTSLIPSLNFTDRYDVTISRAKINSTGSKKLKFEDTIISCLQSKT